MAGSIIAPSLQELQRYFIHIDPLQIKLVLTMPAILIAIFGVPAGWIADKFGRKPVLIAALIIYGLAGISGYFIYNFYWLLFSRACLGVGVAGIMSMATTLAADYFVDKERTKFLGLQSAFMSIGAVLFLVTGGILADISWRLPFIIYGLSFIVLPISMLVIIEPQKIEKTNTNGIAQVSDKPALALIFLLGLLSSIFFYVIPTQLPFLLSERFSITNTEVGIAIATTTVASATTALNYSSIKNIFSYKTLLIISFGIMGVGFTGIAYFKTYITILLALGTVGLGAGLIFPSCKLWMLELVSESVRGRTAGTFTSLIFLGHFCSPFLLKIIESYSDLTTCFLVTGGLLLLTSMAISFFRR